MSYVQLRGEITNIQLIGKSRAKRLSAYLKDETGVIELVWFKGIKWYINKFKPNTEYIVFGQASLFNRDFISAFILSLIIEYVILKSIFCQ